MLSFWTEVFFHILNSSVKKADVLKAFNVMDKKVVHITLEEEMNECIYANMFVRFTETQYIHACTVVYSTNIIIDSFAVQIAFGSLYV